MCTFDMQLLKDDLVTYLLCVEIIPIKEENNNGSGSSTRSSCNSSSSKMEG